MRIQPSAKIKARVSSAVRDSLGRIIVASGISFVVALSIGLIVGYVFADLRRGFELATRKAQTLRTALNSGGPRFSEIGISEGPTDEKTYLMGTVRSESDLNALRGEVELALGRDGATRVFERSVIEVHSGE